MPYPVNEAWWLVQYGAMLILKLEAALEQELNRDETGQRLQTIPGVGPIIARVLSSQLGDGKQYACSEKFWVESAKVV